MTREEAIEELERMLSHWDDLENGKRSFRWYSKDAVEVAISALRPVSREQAEKVWRGEWEWYDEEVGSPLEGIEREWGWRCSKCKTVLPDEFDNPDDSPAMRFCQWCGAPMTDEAVDMMLERWKEAVSNEA